MDAQYELLTEQTIAKHLYPHYDGIPSNKGVRSFNIVQWQARRTVNNMPKEWKDILIEQENKKIQSKNAITEAFSNI